MIDHNISSNLSSTLSTTNTTIHCTAQPGTQTGRHSNGPNPPTINKDQLAVLLLLYRYFYTTIIPLLLLLYYYCYCYYTTTTTTITSTTTTTTTISGWSWLRVVAPNRCTASNTAGFLDTAAATFIGWGRDPQEAIPNNTIFDVYFLFVSLSPLIMRHVLRKGRRRPSINSHQ